LLRGDIKFTPQIMAVCIGMYLAVLALDVASAMANNAGIGGLIMGPTSASLRALGTSGVLSLAQGNWWTLLTANYLHASILHIVFNMMALRSLGPLVEHLFGSSRFFIIYTIAGLAGSLLSSALGTYSSVGASGAVFGLGGALIYYGWRRGGSFGQSIFRNMAFFLGINLVLGFSSRGLIDNWGHLGGLIGGALFAALLGFEEQRRESLWQHILALAALVFVVVCFVLMAVSFFSARL
jgi:rhomboid protease GluP